MNLDIMSLMAASAAVSEAKTATGEGADTLASLTQDSADGNSFSEILQSITASLQNTDDVELAAIDDPAMMPDTSPEALLESLGGEPAARLPETLASLRGGERLPNSGNGLPPADSVDAPSTSDPQALALAALPINAPLASETATLSAGTAALAADEQAGAVANTQTTRGLQRFGWFSQQPNGSTAASSQDATADADGLPPLTRSAAQVRAQPNASLLTGQSLPDAEPSIPVETAKSAVLARQLQTLAAQTAVTGPSASQIESIGLETPRAASIAPGNAAVPTTPVSASAPAALTEALSAPLNLNQTGWDKALGQRLVFMAAKGVDSAELRLDPPQLGKVHVKLSVQSDQAQLMLQASNPLARDAMETALPRLREMLGAEGLQLESAQVTDRNDTDRQRQADDQREARQEGLDDDTSELPDAESASASVETLTGGSGVISERV